MYPDCFTFRRKYKLGLQTGYFSFCIHSTSLYFGRKLIEGEDSRLSTTVRHLSLTGGLPLTSSVNLHAASDSVSTIGDTTSKGVEKAPSNLEKQATEKSERKTLLIR